MGGATQLNPATIWIMWPAKILVARQKIKKHSSLFCVKVINEDVTWANASWTSPPTPAKESCGPWVGAWPACGGGPDEGERIGICIDRGEAWLGEEPAAWAWRERMKT